MGCLMKIAVFILVAAAAIGFLIKKYTTTPEIPKLTVTYWGPGKEKPDDVEIKPFKINVPQSEIEELKKRLDKTRAFTPSLEGVGFEYGFNPSYWSDFIEFWKVNYNWTEREKHLNSYPQYTTQIGGLTIHFLHQKVDPTKTQGKKVLPLLILHGWPGSVREFFGIIPKLTTPRDDADFVFEIVAPSLPGFTFSQGASKPGFGPAHIGVILDSLMARLGHKQYFIHAGDWGSAIGLTMCILNPEKILGFHSTFCTVGTLNSKLRIAIAYLFPQYFVEESRKEQFITQFIDSYILESGYLHIQATKPDTIGMALTDSPAGLAAYFLEKFSVWTNRSWRSLPDGGLENMNKIDLIDNIMLYWFTKSITTSMRLYSEGFNKKYFSLGIDGNVNKVPSACAWFKQELIYNPRFVLEGSYENLIQNSHFEKGGHFSAYEEPELVSEDLRKFVKTLRGSKT